MAYSPFSERPSFFAGAVDSFAGDTRSPRFAPARRSANDALVGGYI